MVDGMTGSGLALTHVVVALEIVYLYGLSRFLPELINLMAREKIRCLYF